MRTAKDLSGQRFGRLTVICRAVGKYDIPHYKCVCDCGNEVIKRGKDLASGNTRSCGCLHKEQLAERNRKNRVHGGGHTRLYNIYFNMINRCYNTKQVEYHNYGGRGVGVCKEWRDSFVAFREWAIGNGYNDILVIDRIDVNGNYEPNNCRWITKREQQFNKTNTRYFEYKGQKKCLAEWAEIFGMNKPTLYNRIYNLGWSIDKALETEVKQRK